MEKPEEPSEEDLRKLRKQVRDQIVSFKASITLLQGELDGLRSDIDKLASYFMPRRER